MADSYTSLLQLIKQETGNNNNNWGVLLNTQVIDRIEAAVAGSSTIAVTGGTTVLTDDQYRAAALVISGTLTSAAIIEVPARTRRIGVYNSTTGNFPVSIRVGPGGTTYVLTRGSLLDLWTDGTAFYESGPGQVPVGSSVFHWATTPPTNFLHMDGAAISRTQYPRLFAVLGTAWGAGDGSTTFNIPDARERYMRARGTTYGIGILGQDVQAHTHTAATDAQGYHGHGVTTSTSAAHDHDYVKPVYTSNFALGGGGPWTLATGSVTDDTTDQAGHSHTVTIAGDGSHAHNVTVYASTGTETRPNSIIGTPAIRYQ